MSVSLGEQAAAGMTLPGGPGQAWGDASHYDEKNPPSAAAAVPLRDLIDDRLLDALLERASISSAPDGSRNSRMSRTSASVNPAPPSSPWAASYHCRRQGFTESEEITSRRVGRIGGAACLTPGPIGTPGRYWLADELTHCCVTDR
jgi:hypothetical protein